jgi:hypothetical protein
MNIELKIEENNGINRKKQPVTVGIPLSKGLIVDKKKLVLKDENKNIIKCQIKILEYWDDKSAKWISLDFKVDIKSNSKSTYYLTSLSGVNHVQEKISLTNNEEFININSGIISVNITKREGGLFSLCLGSKKEESTSVLSVKLVDDKGEAFDAVIENFCFAEDDDNSSQSKDIFIEGTFSNLKLSKLKLKFKSKITFFSDSSYFKLDFTLHNPQAAKHEGGLWDLGDINSINISSLAISLTTPKNSIAKVTDHFSNDTMFFEQDFHIQQFSSGGEYWDSSIHKDASGNVSLEQNGYKIFGKNIEQTGKRILPSIELTSDTQTTCAYIENFWQNFPKAICKKDNMLKLELFPEGEIELQAGEQKTHAVWFDFDSNGQNFDWVDKPLNITLDAEYVASTNALDYFSNVRQQNDLLKIINKGITGANNFFEKREKIDEFGWRNFGELYADHEAAGNKDSELFISHYNNQYDPLYGFIYQFHLTGDKKWFELADDLAKHITDIDIYHTLDDKDEYNDGLFWHTDHYLDASTCTHRTFSKNHQAAYEGYTSGGGPGGQHCYTTGLKSHYLLTGNENSKAAVLQLADWITYSFEGSNCFLAKLFAIKQSGNHGIKDHILEKYPMDRGTGHYIIALLDAYDLTQKQSYLARAFKIIGNTFHPNDDILLRNFDSIESTWFYTVFLQSVGRFLLVKEQMNQLDDDFYYARDAMLHYANWMLENELPYLEQIDKLEFPNTTWAGQDLRKVGIFYMANYYSPINNEAFLGKAAYFHQHIVKMLKNDSSNQYTRILALLMQNIGFAHFYQYKISQTRFANIREYTAPVKLSKWKKTCTLLFKELSRLSIINELKWLSLRSAKVAKLLGNKG